MRNLVFRWHKQRRLIQTSYPAFLVSVMMPLTKPNHHLANQHSRVIKNNTLNLYILKTSWLVIFDTRHFCEVFKSWKHIICTKFICFIYLIQDRIPRRQTPGPNKTDESLDEVSHEPSAQGDPAAAGECTGMKRKGRPGRELKLQSSECMPTVPEHRVTGGTLSEQLMGTQFLNRQLPFAREPPGVHITFFPTNPLPLIHLAVQTPVSGESLRG